MTYPVNLRELVAYCLKENVRMGLAPSGDLYVVCEKDHPNILSCIHNAHTEFTNFITILVDNQPKGVNCTRCVNWDGGKCIINYEIKHPQYQPRICKDYLYNCIWKKNEPVPIKHK